MNHLKTAAAALALLALAGCGRASTPDALAAVAVTDAQCRPTPNGLDVGACYLTLTASRDDRLVSASTPASASAQVHEMKIENGVMKMGELTEGLPLPAGETVSLKPGGDHLMLISLVRPLAVGDHVVLTLTFEHAPPAEVSAAVAQPGLPARDQGDSGAGSHGDEHAGH